jgi:hypothetical protein
MKRAYGPVIVVAMLMFVAAPISSQGTVRSDDGWCRRSSTTTSVRDGDVPRRSSAAWRARSPVQAPRADRGVAAGELVALFGDRARHRAVWARKAWGLVAGRAADPTLLMWMIFLATCWCAATADQDEKPPEPWRCWHANVPFVSSR